MSSPSSIAVLVVDDSSLTRRAVARVLERADGFIVSTASSRVDAEARLAATKVDVVLLDATLPDAAGIDLAGELLARCPAIRVVIMTGWGHDPELVQGAKDAGCSGYLAKSSDLYNNLPSVIRCVFDGGSAFD